MKRLYGTTSLDVLEGAGFEPVLNAQGEQIAAADRSLTEAALQQVQQGIRNLSAVLASSACRGRGGNGPWAYGGGGAAEKEEAPPKKPMRRAREKSSRGDAKPVNCLQTGDLVLVDGDLAAGKTNNLEVDKILQHFFPPKTVLRCHTFPQLFRSSVAEIEKLVEDKESEFLPDRLTTPLDCRYSAHGRQKPNPTPGVSTPRPPTLYRRISAGN
ncbi:hypothetical protein ABB37_07015 [Leptomonas pyrrhocoris]|uniref:Uncharacterized protein n=1 Tax=Leptomonas pyrrhocoris TaxID=157538 RepID=A0A0N0DTN6_LEPPY|nr:hypothetical protein ABB37_07015 [Leptomonas pyrrhocoris]KPA77672.1 hypothetical protein ABB37_07015 [Leptomonas pyrrhocoris]|eukprot:XP_015656111.1 hypothetical protein ABB37_07015 [Leptomonas pyrrhocoris]